MFLFKFIDFTIQINIFTYDPSRFSKNINIFVNEKFNFYKTITMSKGVLASKNIT